MNNNKKTTIALTFLTSLFLFILTFSLFGNLFELLISKPENFQYQATRMRSQIKLRLLFSLAIGLTPIFLYLTWRIARIKTTKKRLYSALLVVAFMAASIVFRQQFINSEITRLANFETQPDATFNTAISIEVLNFEYYLLGGLCLGCVASYFSLRNNEPEDSLNNTPL